MKKTAKKRVRFVSASEVNFNSRKSKSKSKRINKRAKAITRLSRIDRSVLKTEISI